MAGKKQKHDELDMSDDLVNEVAAKPNMNGSEKTDFLQMVREQANEGYEFWKPIFDAAEEDSIFRAGDQWPQYAQKDREASGRPMLVFNDLPQYLAQAAGDQRQNRTSIQVSPADDLGATAKVQASDGTQFTMAETFEGLIRNIEYRSGAEAHYDTAFEHAIEGGFGWLRVLTEYSTPTSFDLDIRIKCIRNRWAVMLDPAADEPDMSDAKWGMIADWMPEHQFRAHYPEAMIGELQQDPVEWWGTKDRVAVSEYFERYAVERDLLMLATGEVVWRDEHDDADLRAVGVRRERKVQTHKVRWWKLTSMDVLRGPVDVPCSTIPIVPVFGKEVRGRRFTTYEGMIRHAKDPKRADNFWITAATERVALSPNAPWLVTAENIEGYEGQWEAANRGSPAFLTFNPDKSGFVPTRQQPATMPVAELQLAATMTDKVKSSIGMYDASLGARSNETSGRAIQARQREADVGTFQFVDNLSRAIRRVGLICTEMIPRVYDGSRTLRLRFPDGKGAYLEANKQEGGKVINDLSIGAYDVVVRTGPSYTTQRQEAADALMEFIRVAPDIGALVADKVAQAMDWPGADEIAERLKHTIPRHMLSKEDQEKLGEVPQPEPTPEQQVEMAKAEADMERAKADVLMAEAKTAEAQARMAEIEAGALTNEHMARIKQMIEEVVAKAMTTVEQAKQGAANV